MFEVAGGPGEAPRVVVNELAMRPHNSGHWTIDGAVTSQFEQHLRAVLDLPLGASEPVAPWSVMVNLLGSGLADPRSAYPEVMARCPRARVHLYGKQVRPGRKLGHVTVSGADLDDVRAEATLAVTLLGGGAAG
jgi:5-(carboxyamino)imidazole ribonucleotide synthase